MRSHASASPRSGNWWQRLFGPVRPAPAEGARGAHPADSRAGPSSHPSRGSRKLAENFQRSQIRQTAKHALLRIGLSSRACEVVVRRGTKAADGQASYFLLLRVNEWRPDIMLRSKQIETHVQQAVEKVYPVRLSHVFWRMGSDVSTPFDEHGTVDLEIPDMPPEEEIASEDEAASTLAAAYSKWPSPTNWGSLGDEER